MTYAPFVLERSSTWLTVPVSACTTCCAGAAIEPRLPANTQPHNTVLNMCSSIALQLQAGNFDMHPLRGAASIVLQFVDPQYNCIRQQALLKRKGGFSHSCRAWRTSDRHSQKAFRRRSIGHALPA